MGLKIQQLDSKGDSKIGQTFEYTVRDFDTGEPMPDVVLTCLVISKAEGRAYFRKHTTRVPDPVTRQMVEKVDNVAVAEEIFRDVVQAWTGITASDDLPAPCSDEHKAQLDDRVKTQVMGAVLGSEVTGRGPETFPEPE